MNKNDFQYKNCYLQKPGVYVVCNLVEGENKVLTKFYDNINTSVPRVGDAIAFRTSVDSPLILGIVEFVCHNLDGQSITIIASEKEELPCKNQRLDEDDLEEDLEEDLVDLGSKDVRQSRHILDIWDAIEELESSFSELEERIIKLEVKRTAPLKKKRTGLTEDQKLMKLEHKIEELKERIVSIEQYIPEEGLI